ncbi:hypothetical protein [Nocardia sp. NPDC050406]|uniref:phthiocerol/phthiodiolone dimycocerosyl transferase family protein n=1 Tax=Nocardia sp. NPDC050406 TaxID=3364318 RepID=UPI0037A4D6C0
MRQRLGTIDHGFVPRKLTVCYAAICVGEVDTALLRRAFELLCRKYPMLGGTLELADGACYVRIREDSSAAVEIVDRAIADWLANATTPLDPERILAKLEIVRDGGVTAVALRVSHAINDATMGFALLQDFWRIAAALSAASALPDLNPVFPGSLENLYAERGLALPRLTHADPGLPLRSIPSSDIGTGTHFKPSVAERIMLSAEQTADLLRYARESGTTLHALLSAAIIRAERAMIPDAPGSATELPMILYHLVDMRPHLQPPAHPADVTNGLGFAPTRTACAPDSDLDVLAKDVKDQISTGIENGSAVAVMLAASAHASTGHTRDSVGSFLTNWGVVPALDQPVGVEIIDFRGFATSDPVTMAGYFAYTFHGRLTVELAYSDRFYRPARITELREHLLGNLRAHTPLTAARSMNPNRYPATRRI